MAFSGSPCHVGLGSRIGPEPPDGNDVERAVRRSITPSVKAVAGCFAGRRRNWAYTAESREAGLGMEALRVVASCQQQLRGGPVANRVPGHESGSQFVDDGGDHGIEVRDLVVQLEVTPAQRLEGDPVG